MNKMESGNTSVTRPAIKPTVRQGFNQNSFGRRSSALSSDMDGRPSSSASSSNTVAAAPTDKRSVPKR